MLIKKNVVSLVFLLQLFLLLGLWGGLVLPAIDFGPVSLYLTTILSVIVTFLVFLLVCERRLIYCGILLKIIILIVFLVVVSALFSWVSGVSAINYRDIIEVVKYAQFIPYLFAIPYLNSSFIKYFYLFFLASLILVILNGFLQVFGIYHLSFLYLEHESGHLKSLLAGKRITITGSDPNVGGVIVAFFCMLGFSYFKYKKNIILGILVSSIMFVFLLYTQSRTVLIGSLVVFVFSVFMVKMKLYAKFSIVISFVLLLIFSLTYFDLDYVTVGIELAMKGENNSLNVRFSNFVSAYEVFKENIVLGVGPSKTNFSTIIDSEYVLILQRYGVCGILIFAFLLAYMFVFSFKNRAVLPSFVLFQFMMLSVFVMLTNNVWSGYQLMSIPIMLYIATKNELRYRRAS